MSDDREAFMSAPAYSEVIEFAPFDFIGRSLLPGSFLRCAYTMLEKYLGYHFYPLFRRMEQERRNFEAASVCLEVGKKELSFPDGRRLLVQAEGFTTYNKRMLKGVVKAYQSDHPFEWVATCVMECKEVMVENTDDWLAVPTDLGETISSELIKSLPEAPEEKSVPVRLREMQRAGAEWLGPAETWHLILPDYCEFAHQYALVHYAGPFVSLGRRAVLETLRSSGHSPFPEHLELRLDFANWKLWMWLRRGLFMNDRVLLQSYYADFQGRSYLKHDLYLERPRVPAVTFLEEHAPPNSELPAPAAGSG
jgi:hypothetical protein